MPVKNVLLLPFFLKDPVDDPGGPLDLGGPGGLDGYLVQVVQVVHVVQVI